MTTASDMVGHSSTRDQLLACVVGQYARRLQDGAPRDVEQFIREHPEHAEELQRFFPTIEAMAQFRLSLRDNSAIATQTTSSPTAAMGVLGDYRIIREVGRGGMGIVYEAKQISLNRRVALKVLPFAAVLDPRQLQRFKNEAQAAAQLHHTNIVPVYSVASERGVHFYAMQFIDGQSLAEVIYDLRRHAGVNDRANPLSALR